MNTETETLVAALNDRLEKMSDDERIEIMRSIMNGYCKECGCVDPSGTCQCWNDE